MRIATQLFCLILVLAGWHTNSFLLFSSGHSIFSAESDIDRCVLNAEYDLALHLADSMIRLKATDNREASFLILKKSQIYMASGNLILARGMLYKAASMIEKIDDPEKSLLLFQALQQGRFCNLSGNYQEALKWLEQGNKFLKEMHEPDKYTPAALNNELGNTLNWLDQPERADRCYRQAIGQITGIDTYDRIANLTYQVNLAKFILSSGKPAEIRKVLSGYLTRLNEKGLSGHPAMLNIYLDCSYIFLYAQFDYAVSEEMLARATDLLEKYYPKDYYKYGQLFYCRGILEYHQNDFEKAYTDFQESLRYARQNSILWQYIPLNYLKLADIASWFRNDYHEAIRLYSEALNNTKQYQSIVPRICINSAKCHLWSGDTLNAISLLHQGIRHSTNQKPYPDYSSIAAAYAELAKTYRTMKSYSRAMNCLTKAFEAAGTLHDDKTKAQLFNNLGRLYLDMGNYDKAVKSYHLSIVHYSPYFTDTSIFAQPLPEAYYPDFFVMKNLYEKAYAFYKLYEKDSAQVKYLEASLQCQEAGIKIMENMMISMENESSGLELIHISRTSLSNAVSYACLLYLRTGNLLYAQKALEYAEKSKMLVILINNHTKYAQKYAGIPDSLVEKEMQLKNEILALQNRIKLNEKEGISPGASEKLFEKLASLQIKSDELSAYFSKTYPRYYNLKYNLHVMDIGQIQKSLGTDQVLIEYQFLYKEIMAFAISRDSFFIHHTFLKESLIPHLLRLRESVAENPIPKDPDTLFRQFTHEACFLYSILIKPFQKVIEEKKIIVVPHNELNLIPFEVLLAQYPGKEHAFDYTKLNYLIRNNPVSYAYSATLLFDQYQQIKPGKKFAIFIPDYRSGTHKYENKNLILQPLQGTMNEGTSIHRLMGGHLFKQGNANENTFKSRASKYNILHIASHTLLDDMDPTLSGIIFSDSRDSSEDGILYSFELYQLKLNASLVVLSGCNTGYGKLRNNEGILSLARSFFYTGVHAVVYALWTAADQAGSVIIQKFYKGIKRHYKLEEALQQAKLEYLSTTDPVKCHPYYWAGYLVSGNTDPLPVNRSARNFIILTVWGFMFILAWMVYRKIST